ncbi:MAG TPA: hypothetical protein PLD20_25120 [Blastocatellia bacterium]|nr:hypothetical protein [Blastocatellia bacterium]HMV86553.1 hypothetical protein [Blastocatellia bacterium]HMX29041.1 hypothetical protein [Blastocatellia bacterium]HMY76797.1 hypothetical protein [Blastocatellia bacterium]HMZ21240.1 hypothetical protein [Blastocatellia bacterium]
MSPEVSHTHTRRKLAPRSSLNTLLVLPVPKEEALQRTLWTDFLSDLSFLLPAFGIVFGMLFLLGQSPFLGAGLVTVCPVVLALRIHVALQTRRERRRVNELVNWYRQHRVDYGNYRIDYSHRAKAVTPVSTVLPIADEMPDVMIWPVPPAKN